METKLIQFQDIFIEDNEEKEGLLDLKFPLRTSTSEKLKKTWLLVIFQSLLLLLAFVTLAVIWKLGHYLEVYQKPNRFDPDKLRSYPCGLDPDTARAAGCKFDLGSVSWLPTESFDEELNVDFMAQGSWPLYKNTSDFDCNWSCTKIPEIHQLDLLPSTDAVSINFIQRPAALENFFTMTDVVIAREASLDDCFSVHSRSRFFSLIEKTVRNVPFMCRPKCSIIPRLLSEHYNFL